MANKKLSAENQETIDQMQNAGYGGRRLSAPALTAFELAQLAATILAGLIAAPKPRGDHENKEKAISLAKQLYQAAVEHVDQVEKEKQAAAASAPPLRVNLTNRKKNQPPTPDDFGL